MTLFVLVVVLAVAAGSLPGCCVALTPLEETALQDLATNLPRLTSLPVPWNATDATDACGFISGTPWTGITCNSITGSVTNIVLEGRGINGFLPSSIGNLRSLLIFNMANNTIRGEIPESMWNLTSLTRLSLWSNRLTGTLSPSIGRLSNLTLLYIYENDMNGTLPREMGQLKKVTSFLCFNNAFSGSIPAEMGDMTELDQWGCSGNQLNGSLPSSLGRLSSLRNLNLGSNRLTGPFPASLTNITFLEMIQLSGNNFTGTLPASLSRLRRLSILKIGGSDLEGPLPNLVNCTDLSLVELQNNRFNGTIPPFPRAPNINNWWLNGNQLTGTIPPSIVNIAGANQIDLSNNNLTGTIPYGALLGMSQLTRFNIFGNDFSGCFDAPRSLTNCNISSNTGSLCTCGNVTCGAPCTYCDQTNGQSCPRPPALPTECSSRTCIDGDVVLPGPGNSTLVILTPTIILGNLTIISPNGSITIVVGPTIELGRPPLEVRGPVSLGGTLVVRIDPTSVSSNFTVILFSTPQSGTPSTFDTLTVDSGCRKLIDPRLEYSRTSVQLLWSSVDDSACSPSTGDRIAQGGLSDAAVIGIAVGCAVFGLIVIIAIIYLTRTKFIPAYKTSKGLKKMRNQL